MTHFQEPKENLFDVLLGNSEDRIKAFDAAEEVLEGLTDKDRVHFALKLVLNTTDKQAADTVSYVARQIG